jgi:carboxylesterase type B
VFKQKVIVVTFAYRLNVLGFFTSLDGEAPGNFGLKDQAAAFFWVKNNIKAFGGDEENITLMGHGSGATSGE